MGQACRKSCCSCWSITWLIESTPIEFGKYCVTEKALSIAGTQEASLVWVRLEVASVFGARRITPSLRNHSVPLRSNKVV